MVEKTYQITVATANYPTADTDANVSLTVYGSLGFTPPIFLDNPRRDDFEKGQKDTFAYKGLDIGDIRGIHIRHDNTYGGPGWLLEYVNIKEVGGSKDATFRCNRWLAVDEDDRQIYRFIGDIPLNVPFSSSACDRLKVGEWMRTSATLSRPSNRIDAVTQIWTNNELSGFTGSVAIVFADQTGNILGRTSTRSAGVDGTLIPGKPSTRAISWNESVSGNIVQNARSIAIVHSLDPKNRFENILDDGIRISKKVGDVLKEFGLI